MHPIGPIKIAHVIDPFSHGQRIRSTVANVTDFYQALRKQQAVRMDVSGRRAYQINHMTWASGTHHSCVIGKLTRAWQDPLVVGRTTKYRNDQFTSHGCACRPSRRRGVDVIVDIVLLEIRQ